MRAVLLHPHPDMGGDMHNNVITALYDTLPDAHRFDFESADPEAAASQVVTELGDEPAVLVGYSFGGGIASLVDDPRVQGWFLIAPALTMVAPVIGPDTRPKHVLAAEHDQFFGAAALRVVTEDWAATTHDVVGSCDHFMVGRATEVARRCAAWMGTRTAWN